MRVLAISESAHPEGGVQRYTQLMRRSLEQAGDEVRLMTSSAGPGSGAGADYVAYSTNWRPAKAVLQLANPSAARQARIAVREFEPDAIVVNAFLPQLSPSALWALRERPTLLLIHDYAQICPIGAKLLPNGRICSEPHGAVCRRGGCIGRARNAHASIRYAHLRSARAAAVDEVVTISAWMQQVLAREGIEAGLLHLPVAAPQPSFERRPAATPRFLFAGRITAKKGVETLVRAFGRVAQRHPRAELRLSGDGERLGAVRALVADLGLAPNVRLLVGMREDWTRELASAWALVTPSVYPEPLGLVAIEAVVHGVPVIASRTGGLPETVEDGRSGLLVAPGNGDRLADAMLAIADRHAFPNHTIDAGVRRAVADRHNVGSHVDGLRARLAALTMNGAHR